MEHQSVVNMDSKTKAALKDKEKKSTDYAQANVWNFEIWGNVAQVPFKKFEMFNEWLKSPSGGKLHWSEEISEVNRFLYFCCRQKSSGNNFLKQSCSTTTWL